MIYKIWNELISKMEGEIQSSFKRLKILKTLFKESQFLNDKCLNQELIDQKFKWTSLKAYGQAKHPSTHL